MHGPFFAREVTAPNAPALLSDDDVLTYGELAAQALGVAGHLRAQGVVPGDLVAIDLPKGPEQIVAVLGVLAVGAAYLPLGAQPQPRKDRILATADVAHILDALVFGDPIEPALGGDLAYVLYTSGSTGEPKGVEITHFAAANTIDDLNERFEIGPGTARWRCPRWSSTSACTTSSALSRSAARSSASGRPAAATPRSGWSTWCGTGRRC